MGILLVFHVIVCVMLIGAILLQAGRGASTGAAFGGGGSGTFFGPSGASSFLGRVIVVLVIIFAVTTVILFLFSTRTIF